MILKTKNREIEFGTRSLIMGILNVTPDSFSDGGNFYDSDTAVGHAVEMLRKGADIIDIGGESTRPGAEELTCQEEIFRVVPVIEKLRNLEPECIISIDTRKAEVAEKAVEAGADIINDISGLQFCKEIADVAAQTGAGLVLMHMRGNPDTMQSEENLKYDNVVDDITDFLQTAIDQAVAVGVKPNQIAVDPGIGFSKKLEQNIEILHRVNDFRTLNCPILVGHSRKSFIGQTLNESDPQKRVWGTAGVTAWLVMNGIEMIRVHDVEEMSQVATLVSVCKNGNKINKPEGK